MEGIEDVLTSSLEEERQAVFGFLFTFFDEASSSVRERDLPFSVAASYLTVTSCSQTLTLLQEVSCDVELYPWAPGVFSTRPLLLLPFQETGEGFGGFIIGRAGVFRSVISKACVADVLAISDILMEEAVAASPTGIEGLNLPLHLVPTRDGQMDLDALLLPANKHLWRLCQASEVAEIARAADVEWPPETPFQQLSIPVTTRSCGTSGISLLREFLLSTSKVHLREKSCQHTRALTGPTDVQETS